MKKLFIITSLILGLANAVQAQNSTPLPPKTDYVLSIAQNTLSVSPGASGSTSISFIRSRSFQKAKGEISAYGFPNGVEITFEPAKDITGNETTMTVRVAANVPAGEYNITVSSKMGYKNKAAFVKLIVQ